MYDSLLQRQVCVCVRVLSFYPETILVVVLVRRTRRRRRGRFTPGRRWGIVGNGVPAHSQLRLVDGGQWALLLAPGPQRRLHWLLAAGEARVGVDHALHLCGEQVDK